MASPRINHKMFNQLMDINQEAFGQGLYEVAYHALAAALHCAYPLEEQVLLDVLERRAREQRDWIDSSASEHVLSSQSASLRGHESVYNTLIRQIQTRKLMQQSSISPHPDTAS